MIPKTIECFGISNLGKQYSVGSIPKFVYCIPDKTGYRKFKINIITG